MIFIFVGSTDLLSAEHTSRYIGPFLRWFSPNVSDATIAIAQLGVRKCAHLCEYAILAALFFRALRVFGSAFILSVIYAGLDEFHQSFVASRTASPWDVAVDCVGALVGLAIYRFFTRKSQIPNRK